MRVMTALAFRIQALYDKLIIREQADEESRVFDKIRVIGELVELSLSLNSVGEIGLRKTVMLDRNASGTPAPLRQAAPLPAEPHPLY